LPTLSPATQEYIRAHGLWPVDGAAEWLSIDRTHVYTLARRGELVIIKIGRRSYVTPDSLIEFLSTREHLASA
jgi:hypothetical protein